MGVEIRPISSKKIRVVEIDTISSTTSYEIPKYSPDDHYLSVASNPYFLYLTKLRDILKEVTDDYFRYCVNAVNVDLYLTSQSVSSPMGQGSNSEPVHVKIFDQRTHLVDSSQFGFEPMLMNEFDHVYCFLPSFRGEDADNRHLNQFYHAEYEGSLGLSGAQQIANCYVVSLARALLANESLLRALSRDANLSVAFLKKINGQNGGSFPSVEFDQAAELLHESGYTSCVKCFPNGRDINALGELKIGGLLGFDTPFWITHFDRDRVPFYQKPLVDNPLKVGCADLIFPSLFTGAFGGEVLGAGERQSDFSEMKESLSRQGVNSTPYDWYINLRKKPNYSQTSGFGLGFERFIAAILGLENIRDAILYPRIKGENPTP